MVAEKARHDIGVLVDDRASERRIAIPRDGAIVVV